MFRDRPSFLPSGDTSASLRAGASPAKPLPADALAALNAEQRAAVEYAIGASAAGEARPLLVIAGAGTGKTETLAWRVAHLVAAGADPQRILLLTFSRRAAAEMERRAMRHLGRMVGTARRQVPGDAFPWAGTFHSVGARLLREYAARIGLRESFTILDRGDAENLLGMVRHETGMTKTKHRFPVAPTCLAIYSRAVNAEAPLTDVLKRAYPWCAHWEEQLRQLFDAYVAAKQAQNVLDYDDLLLYWSHMVAEPSLAQEIGARFDCVLVDEYQDTNRLQASILLAMKPDGAGVTVVGDDAQSIYSFRAATVRNILDFPQCFSPPARVMTLDRNYRSTQPVLEASNAVIALAAERFTKSLWTDRASAQKPRLVAVRDEGDQARYVAEQVLECREQGAALRSQAVLFRSSSHSALLELELARRGIPFVKYGGLRFLEASHIKDVLCVLRWTDNPRDRMAGFRAVRLLPGVGPATALRLLDALDGTPDVGRVLEVFGAPPAAAPAWREFRSLFHTLHARRSDWPTDLEVLIRWYEPHLHRLYDDAVVRQRDVLQLLNIASTYASRERFLTELTLDPPEATSDQAGQPDLNDDYLILSTIHSAKGQEWKAVYLLNVVDGCIPADMSTGTPEEVEEERRLLYVAMTRAKETLHLLQPQRFHVHQQSAYGDRHVYGSRTRFIPDALASLFECCTWPVPDRTADAASATRQPAAPVVDIAARIRKRWA